MLSKLKNGASKISQQIESKTKKATSRVSNLVIAILLSSGIGLGTKAEANIPDFSNNISKHKVVKGDGLYKISKLYGLTINELKNLNKNRKYGNHSVISEDETIYLGSELIVSSFNKIANESNKIKTKLLNISDKKNTKQNIINKENNQDKYSSNLKTEKENNLNIKLSNALKYSAMYEKKGTNYKKHYTISPSDTPYFTGGIKKISGRLYVEVRLANDKNITGYVRITTFDIESRKLIKKLFSKEENKTIINTKRNENERAKTVKITTKKKIETQKNNIKKENIKKTGKLETIKSEIDTKKINDLETPIINTLNYAGKKSNLLRINDIGELKILSKKLNYTKRIIERLNNEKNARIILNHKISILSLYINIKNPTNENSTISEIFDHYATLERLLQFKIYFSKSSFEDIYKNHIKVNFGGNWKKGLNILSLKAGLKDNISKYNPRINEKILELRKKGINNLLKTISIAENTNNNYNAIFSNGNQNKIKYTQMTIREVLKDMKVRIKTKGSSATGKYQFMYKTLKNLAKTYKIDIDKQLFSEKFQEKIARIKLKERGLEKFIKGKLDRDRFQANLSMEWASLAEDQNNKSYHHADGINKAFCSNDKIDSILDNIKNPKPTINTTRLASL